MHPSRRADGLDGLRGLAAAAIVLLHVWMFSGANDPQQPQLVDQMIGALSLSLMMFFVLSGYLVSRPWVRQALGTGRPPNLRNYAIKRAARILPAYWLVVLAGFFLMQGIEHPLRVDLPQVGLFAIFLQNQVPSTAEMLNPPLWSLGVEVMFYLALPLIGLGLVAFAGRWGRTGMLALAGVLTFAGLAWTAMLQELGVPVELLMSLPTYLPIFACGIAAAVLIEGRSIPRRWNALLFAGGSALAIANGYWHHDGTPWIGQVLRDFPAGIGFAMLVAASVNGPAHILGWGPFRRLGDWSYGIYLWHMPVLYLLRHQGWWPDSPWLVYAYVMGTATLLGAASWLLLEQRVLAWAHRRTKPAPAMAPSDEGAGHAGAYSPPEGDREPALAGQLDR